MKRLFTVYQIMIMVNFMVNFYWFLVKGEGNKFFLIINIILAYVLAIAVYVGREKKEIKLIPYTEAFYLFYAMLVVYQKYGSVILNFLSVSAGVAILFFLYYYKEEYESRSIKLDISNE